MLARNFKTAVDLKLQAEQYNALIKVLGMLERGELKFADIERPGGPNGFNMSRVWNDTHCGSVGCIKGWCEKITNTPMLFSLGSGLLQLEVIDLFMYGDNRSHRVTPEQGAAGIRNYLATGYADWDSVLGQ